MLLRFTAKNFLSFRDEVEFSMIATKNEDHLNHVIEGDSSTDSPKVLRAAGIYGANAHGKTKFVEAVKTLQSLVVRGADKDIKLPAKPFKIEKEYLEQPTEMTIVFRAKGVDYEYGIVFDAEYIEEEWLYEQKTSGEKMLFERQTKKSEVEDEFITKVNFGTLLKRQKSSKPSIKMSEFLDFIAEGTGSNQPFLREAFNRNVRALQVPYKWFRSSLIIIGADANYRSLHTRAQKEEDFVEFMASMMSNSDTGIKKFEVDEERIDFSEDLDMTEKDIEKINKLAEKGQVVSVGSGDGAQFLLCRNSDGDLVTISLSTVHQNKFGEEIRLGLDEESSGTHRLIHLIPILMTLAKGEKTFVVDELDRKLHPLLSYKFIELFLNIHSRGQLIFTTHNTHLLNAKLLRKDEIWFVQKKTDQSTSMYSSSDLNVREGLDIEKGYLNGRFGAIPFIGDLKDLGWEKELEAAS